MIRRNSSFNPPVVCLVLTFFCAVLAFLWGCHEAPFGADRSDEIRYHNALPLPEGRKPDLATVTGRVEVIDYTALHLQVCGMRFFADAETDIEVDGCKPSPFDTIHIDDLITVKHDRLPAVDGSYYCHEIEIEVDEAEEPDGPEPDEAECAGVVEMVAGNRLVVAGEWFWWNEATVIELDNECGDSDVLTGDLIKIEHSTIFTDTEGYYVFKMEIKRECDDEAEVAR